MPTYRLVPHPDRPPRAVRGVAVSVVGGNGGLRLTYRIDAPERVVWPPTLPATRADELWRTTCFELFLRSADERYVEFNFSPSGRWAAYAFGGYRDGMTPLPRDFAPFIDRLPDGAEVDCALGGLPPGQLAMALSAVIEEEGGVRSFWALRHAPGAPDFHSPACFIATLPAPERA